MSTARAASRLAPMVCLNRQFGDYCTTKYFLLSFEKDLLQKWIDYVSEQRYASGACANPRQNSLMSSFVSYPSTVRDYLTLRNMEFQGESKM